MLITKQLILVVVLAVVLQGGGDGGSHPWAMSGVAAAADVDKEEAESESAADPACRVSFPASFFVSTGVTVPNPGAGAAPASQSGALYVDGEGRRMRIDQFLLERQHTFIADETRRRAYVFERGPAGNKGASNVNCRVFSLRGRVTPLCVPPGYVRDDDMSLVRGVPVARYTGYDRSDGDLLQIDYYVFNATLGAAYTAAVPWRIHTRFNPAAELPRIAGAPVSTPNWRYFGQPMFDEVVLAEAGAAPGSDVQLWVPEYDAMTVDFFNFVPLTPAPSVFAVPQECVAAEAAWEQDDAAAAECGAAQSPAGASCGGDVSPPVAHRFLIDWSLTLAQQG